jgi:hypothetical protein
MRSGLQPAIGRRARKCPGTLCFGDFGRAAESWLKRFIAKGRLKTERISQNGAGSQQKWLADGIALMELLPGPDVDATQKSEKGV